MAADTNPSRRALLAGAAAVGIPEIAAFVRPVSAAANADAELLKLVEPYRAARRRYEDADRRRDAAVERHRGMRVEIPAALFWRESDEKVVGTSFKLDDELGGPNEATRTGRQGFFHPEMISALRMAHEYLRAQPVPDFPVRKAFISDLARLEELVATGDEYLQCLAGRWTSSGMEDAEAAVEKEIDDLFGLRLHIIASRARTAEGLLFKLEVAEDTFREDDASGERMLEERSADGHAAEENVAFSIVLDLVRLARDGRLQPVVAGLVNA